MRRPGTNPDRPIDDLRLSVTMVKLDACFGNWNLRGMLVPEARFSLLPVFGSDFYCFPALRPVERDPGEGFENLPAAAALTGVFSGWRGVLSVRRKLRILEPAIGCFWRSRRVSEASLVLPRARAVQNMAAAGQKSLPQLSDPHRFFCKNN